MNSVQQRLVRIRNELRAQKVASERAYSSMLWPENAPTASYNGTFNGYEPASEEVYARVIATFTRTDDKGGAPLVDLAVDSELYTREQSIKDLGGQISGRDLAYGNNGAFNIYVAETTDSSVTFNIDILTTALLAAQETIPFNLFATAISPVPGTLTLRRAI